MKQINYILIVFLSGLLTFVGCGRNNNFIRLDTPLGLYGFLGFRWGASKDLVEKRFLQYCSGSVPLPMLSNRDTSSYSNVSFLSERASLCQFCFNINRYYSAKLTFKVSDYPANYSTDEEVRYLREKLSEYYGHFRRKHVDLDTTNHPYVLKNYRWLDCRLEMMLMSDSSIVITAYETRTCYPKPYEPMLIP